MKKTLYQSIKEIINKQYLDSTINNSKIITRKELINMLMSDEYKFYPNQHCYAAYNYIGKPIRCKDFNIFSLNTLDNIRNMFEKSGYLSKCYVPNTNQQKIILGYYSINKLISDNLSYNQLRKEYNQLQKEYNQLN